jgi:hypothetical protein
MPLFFTVDEKLNFSLELIVDPALREQDVAALFKRIVVVAAKTRREYNHFMDKEGRILGQERTQLIEDLDELFSCAALLSTRIRKNETGGGENLRMVPLRMKHNKFLSEGRLLETDAVQVGSFSLGYELLVLNRMKELLANYRNLAVSPPASEKRAGSIEELAACFDEILYNLLVMRYNLQNCLLDS